MTFYARNLPHWHPDGKALFVTWRLFGSLPRTVLEEYRALNLCDSGEAFARIDRTLDRAQSGPKWLAHHEIAAMIVGALRRGDGGMKLFRLFSYVVMPNHVHVLLQPGAPLAKITKGIKGATARRANSILGRSGVPFWQDESFDHWTRSGQEVERIKLYIEWNPVKAGLVKEPGQWPWSSASSTGF
ncbi:MAG TPA: transposase [Patescibacteria group bacterium]|nr:transposase [Patescibacteria group bacterium]